MFILKGQVETELKRDEIGFLHIRQGVMTVRLSELQVGLLLDWLKEGNGLALERDWNNGQHKDED